MKVITYEIMHERNCGTEEEKNIVQEFTPIELRCNEEDYAAAYALAQREAYNGEITVEDIPDPEAPETNEVSWDAMAAAITEGVNDVE